MLDGIRHALVGGILFFFAIAGLSRILTAKQVPGLITDFGTGLSNLFNGARS